MQVIDGRKVYLWGTFMVQLPKYKSLQEFKKIYMATNQCPTSCTQASSGINSNDKRKVPTKIKSNSYLNGISADKKLRALFKMHHSVIPISIAAIISFTTSKSLLDNFIQTTSILSYNIAMVLYIMFTAMFVWFAVWLYLYGWWNEAYNIVARSDDDCGLND